MVNESKEIEIYKGWRIRVSTNKNNKTIYLAYFDTGPRDFPLILDSESLEELKIKIDRKSKRKVLLVC